MQGSLTRLRRLHLLTRVVVLSLVGSMLALVAALVGSTPAYAAGTPDVQLTGGPAASVLYGRNVPVSLTASLPAGAPKGYNLAFRFVLPAGTSYVGGTAGLDGDPTILADAPTTGRTTLIWPNVDDLVASSGHTIAFEVAYNDTGSVAAPRYDVGDQIAITSGAYLSTDPRDEADFTAAGVPAPGVDSYTGWAEKDTTTDLTAIQIRKSEPHPEGEIPRGVHDHQTVYTLTITNNEVNPTNGVWVEDYLPAGLEFLGCAGTPDHTTDAPTNPGSAEEYVGSGPIDVTHPTGPEHCVAPDLVETVDTDPDGSGPLPSGVYTHVTWDLVGNFSPSQVTTLTYAAAIPIRENTVDWDGPTPALTGAQAVNLDNNSGPETYDEQPLLNGALAHGTYQAPSKPGKTVQDEGTLLRTAEDIAIQKSNNLGTLEQGDLTMWTIDLQASEYRWLTDVVIHDVVPDGLCPLGTSNLTFDPSGTDSECAPVGGKEPSAPYTTVAEQAVGTFDITWDKTTFPELAKIDPSDIRQLTFWTRTRTSYQQDFDDATPVLSNDAVRNDIDTTGTDWVRCDSGDPFCTGAGTKIDHTEPDGEPDTDVSGSGKAATGPIILKQVADEYPADGNCNNATYGKNVPSYGPGDLVCWKLRLDFPTKLDTSSQDVFDVLPAGIEYVDHSWQVTADNDVPVGTIDSATAGRLSWPIGAGGTDIDAGGQTFEVTIKTQVGSPLGHHSGDVEGNLQKFSYVNTADKAFTLRDRVDFALTLPVLGLAKGVRQLDGGAVHAPGIDNVQVLGGSDVTYALDVTNTGGADAADARVWDLLPDGITCAEVSSISHGGSCTVAEDRIEWSGLDLAVGASTTLTYHVAVPTDVSPGQSFVNHAGVVEYAYETNDATSYQLIPDNTDVVDPALPDPNVVRAEDPSKIFTGDAAVSKTAVTEVTEPGNGVGEATIGEVIDYTVTTKIPKGTTIYGTPTVVDALGARQTLVPGSLCQTTCTIDGDPVAGAGITVVESPANAVLATFPATYANTTGHDVDLVLHFKAVVLDVGANTRGTTITNTATLTFRDQDNGLHTKSGTVNTKVVEPKVLLSKSHTPGGRVSPGQVLDFTITVGNQADDGSTYFSPAHDVVVTDVVPAGTEPVDAGGSPIADGAAVWSPNGGIWDAATRTITWTSTTTPSLATINPGANQPLTYRVKVETTPVAGATYTNTAGAEASSLLGPVTGERTSGSSASTAGDYHATAQDVLRVVLPSISKTVGPDPVTIGSEVTWHVTVTVPAHLQVYDATVVDTVPDGLDVDSYGSTTCPSCPGGDPTIAPLPVVNGSAGSRVAAWYLGDLAPSAQVRTYDLVLVGHVRDTYRAGGADVLGGAALTNSATIGTNRHDVVTTNPTTVPGSFEDTVGPATAVTHVLEPHLTIDKAVNDGPTVKPGQPLTYTITVTNDSLWPAHDVVVTDRPDTELVGVTPVAGAGFVTDGWTAANPDMAWTIPGPIAPGATVTLTYTANVAAPGVVPPSSTVHNTATIDVYYGLPAAERQAHPATEYRDYHGPSDSVDLTVIPYADVEITKTADQSSYHGGDVVTWTLTVTNHGLSPAANVVVTDTIPGKATFQSATPGAPTCTFASPTVTCNLGTMASGVTQVITIKGVAKGLPPANQTAVPHSHDLTVSKVEQYVTLTAGQSTTVDLSCANNGYLSDGAAEILHVDQGTGAPTDVVVGRASTLNPTTYRFTLANGTTGQAQVKVFGTCLPHDTEVSEGHSHGLDVSAATTLDTGLLGVGRHSFMIPVSAGHHGIAPGIQLQSGNARLVGSEAVAGGWRFTVEVLTPAQVTLSLRELGDETLGAAPSGHQHALTFQHVVRTVSVPAGESVQRVTCPDGYKGIVATYDLPAGVVLLGHEPQPINRDFRVLNTTGHAVDVTLDLECVAIRTGPALDETFTLTNSATVATTTYDPDLSNNSDSVTAQLTVSAGTTLVGHASPVARTLEIGRLGKAATVTIQCGSSVTLCTGTIRLTARVLRSGKRPVRVVIGSRAYRVAAGTRAEIRIKVKSRYHKAIRRDRLRAFRLR